MSLECVFDFLGAGRVVLIGIGGKAEGSRMDRCAARTRYVVVSLLLLPAKML